MDLMGFIGFRYMHFPIVTSHYLPPGSFELAPGSFELACCGWKPEEVHSLNFEFYRFSRCRGVSTGKGHGKLCSPPRRFEITGSFTHLRSDRFFHQGP